MSFKNKALMLWTKDECKAWALSLVHVDRKLIKALVDEIEDEEFTGADLKDFCETNDDLKDQLEDRLQGVSIKPSERGKVVTAFGVVMGQSRSNGLDNIRNAAVTSSVYMNYNYNCTTTTTTTTTSSTFSVLVSGMGKSRTKKIEKVRATDTVKQLKHFISDKEGTSVKNFGLAFGGRELSDNLTMQKCGIGNDSVVHFISLTNGGTHMPGQVRNRRHINWSAHPHIQKTRKPDCIFAYRTREGYSVAQMSCGHAMECESMHQYINSIIEANAARVRIFCPIPKCRREWEFKICCRVAGMDDAEYIECARKKDLREGDDIRVCPHCGATCKRKPRVAILRMNCSSCSNSDWCWVCGRPWKNSGSLMYCGNANCKFIANINKQLSLCEASVPFGWETIDRPENEKKLPVIRACPACLRFTRKPKGCKHMTCAGCKNKFCFACLRSQKVCDAGKRSAHEVFCFVAARQKF